MGGEVWDVDERKVGDAYAGDVFTEPAAPGPSPEGLRDRLHGTVNGATGYFLLNKLAPLAPTPPCRPANAPPSQVGDDHPTADPQDLDDVHTADNRPRPAHDPDQRHPVPQRQQHLDRVHALGPDHRDEVPDVAGGVGGRVGDQVERAGGPREAQRPPPLPGVDTTTTRCPASWNFPAGNRLLVMCVVVTSAVTGAVTTSAASGATPRAPIGNDDTGSTLHVAPGCPTRFPAIAVPADSPRSVLVTGVSVTR